MKIDCNKTEKFFKKYPNAQVRLSGMPCVNCVKSLGYQVNCSENCERCWNTPLDESED